MEDNWIINDANRILKNIFIFDHPWDMEACPIPKEFNEKIDWNIFFNKDEEWTYMLSRFRFCETLTQAFIITKNNNYIKKAKNLILDFITETNIEKDKNLYRSIDSSLRVMHILKSIQYLNLSPLEKIIINEFLETQIEYLLKFDNSFLRVSNWGVITDCGTLSLLFYFKDFRKDEKQTFKQIENRILNNLNNSIYDGGFHFEMSPMYHVEVLLALLQLIEIKSKYNISYSLIKIEKYALRLSKMLIYTMKNNYHIFMQGDSDDSSLIDLMTYASFVLNSPFLKSIAKDTLPSHFSITDQEKYKKIPKAKIFNKSVSLIESGNFYLRNKDLTTHFRCGFIPSGHAHNDILHFDVIKNGIDILVDSGRYTYRNTIIRKTLKQAVSHNSIVINDEDCLNPIDSWRYNNTNYYINNEIIEKNGLIYIEAANLSYIKLNNSIVNRSLIQIENQYLIIIDKISSPKKVKINRYFHFDNKGKVEKVENTITYKIKNYSSYLKILDNDSLEIINTPYSKKYNALEEKKTLKTESFEKQTLKVSILCFDYNYEIEENPVYHGKSLKKLDKNIARSFIIKGKKEVEILIQSEINNYGVSTICSKNIEGFGSVLVKINNKIVRLK